MEELRLDIVSDDFVQQVTSFGTIFLRRISTHLHMNLINFGEHPSDRPVSTAYQYPERIKMAEKPQPRKRKTIRWVGVEEWNVRWPETYPRPGPPFMRSNTWAGLSNCLKRRKNLTPWLSPDLELTKTNKGEQPCGRTTSHASSVPGTQREIQANQWQFFCQTAIVMFTNTVKCRWRYYADTAGS